jgi:hypothetical protein
MVWVNVPYEVRYQLFCKAYKTAALLDGFTVIEIAGKAYTSYVHWSGENPKFTNYLHIWGEAGTVKIKTDKTPSWPIVASSVSLLAMRWGIREILIECGIQCDLAPANVLQAG